MVDIPDEILDTLKEMNFADIEEQGYMPLYSREEITDPCRLSVYH